MKSKVPAFVSSTGFSFLLIPSQLLEVKAFDKTQHSSIGKLQKEIFLMPWFCTNVELLKENMVIFFLTCLCLTLSTHPSSEPARHSNGIETVPSKLVHTLLDEFATALLVFISSNAAFNLCSSSLRYPVQNHMRKMSPKAL